MLDVRQALRKHGLKFAGRRLDLTTWKRLAQEVISYNLKEIPAEFTARDLFELARDEDLIIELESGFLALHPKLWSAKDWKKIEKRLWQGIHGVDLGSLGRLFVVCVIERLQPIKYEQLYHLVCRQSPVDLSGFALATLLEILVREGILLNANGSSELGENGKYSVTPLGNQVVQNLKNDLTYKHLDLLEQRVEGAVKLFMEERDESKT